MHDAWVFPEFSTIITPRPRASLTKDAANVVSNVLEVKQSATFPAIEVSFNDIDRQLPTLRHMGHLGTLSWRSQYGFQLTLLDS